MSLENELAHFKAELKSEEEKLAKFESLDTTQMDEEQLKAYNRGVSSHKENIAEIKEIIAEIIEEMEES